MAASCCSTDPARRDVLACARAMLFRAVGRTTFFARDLRARLVRGPQRGRHRLPLRASTCVCTLVPSRFTRARILVVARADVDRLAQLSVRGPLVELHLDDDLRRHPVHGLVGRGVSSNGELFRSSGASSAYISREPRVVEAAAHVAGVDEAARGRSSRGGGRRCAGACCGARSIRRRRTPGGTRS